MSSKNNSLFKLTIFALLSLPFFLWGETLEKAEGVIYGKELLDFPRAIALARGKTVIIDKPIYLYSDLTIPPQVDILFLGNGSLVKRKRGRISLVIRAPITAPPRQIFRDFQPGEVMLENSQRALPQWWGAKANDEEDDSLPFQCAIDSGTSLVFLPQGRYIVNKPINITNRPAGGLIIQGEGFAHSAGTIIYANTGGVLFDTSGSQYIEFRDFSVEGGGNNPSTIAFLFARSAKTEYTKYAQFNSLTNIRVRLPSLPTANNGNGTVAVYNYASELWRAWNIYLVADQPLVFTGYNIFQVKSPFTDLWGGYPSMSECTVDGASTLHALDGACVTVDNGIAIRLVNTYLTGGAKTEGRPRYAINLRGPGMWNYAFTFSGHFEYDGGLLRLGVKAVNLRLSATGGPRPEDVPIILLDDPVASISGGEITYTHIDPSISHTYPLIKAGKHSGITGMTINLYPGQSISAPEGEFRGNIVKCLMPFKPKMEVDSKAEYILLGAAE